MARKQESGQKPFRKRAIQPYNTEGLEPAPELLKVQHLFTIAPDDYERLKGDIAETGEIRDPIIVYRGKNGRPQILAGKTRWEIAKELKWEHVPIETRDDLKPGDRERLALRDNLNRRHMSAAQKRAVVDHLLKLDPGKSNRTIAGETGADHKTVGRARGRLESSGEIPQIGDARKVRRGSSAYEMRTGGIGKNAETTEDTETGTEKEVPPEIGVVLEHLDAIKRAVEHSEKWVLQYVVRLLEAGKKELRERIKKVQTE